MFFDPIMEQSFYLARKMEQDMVKLYSSPEFRPILNQLQSGMIRDSLAAPIKDKQIIGNKSYYMDYDKGIIYDNLLNSVGNIGEFGEINI